MAWAATRRAAFALALGARRLVLAATGDGRDSHDRVVATGVAHVVQELTGLQERPRADGEGVGGLFDLWVLVPVPERDG